MNRRVVAVSFALIAGVLLLCAREATAQTASPAAQIASPSPDLIARGSYLVNDAGACTDCHRANLGGGPNFVKSAPGAPAAAQVPSLRGLPMFSNDAAAITFLTTAILPDGSQALRPMPHYHFNQADAQAIVAYLRSLK
jgi:mono/diheme cytochrome c family protein